MNISNINRKRNQGDSTGSDAVVRTKIKDRNLPKKNKNDAENIDRSPQSTTQEKDQQDDKSIDPIISSEENNPRDENLPSSQNELNQQPYQFPESLPNITVKDGSGNVVPLVELTDTERKDLVERMNKLRETSPDHYNVLKYIEEEVINAFGEIGFHELYKGGHIIFNDGGNIYDQLFLLAKELGPSPEQVEQPNDVMDKTTAAGTPIGSFAQWTSLKSSGGVLTPSELKQGLMFKRRAGTNETSHYGSQEELAATDENRPQLGIDLPSSVIGHFLFGVTPSGNTFVQTEGAGFQDFNQHVIQHGMGFLWNYGWSLQTGLVGTSTHSEKTKGGSTALKE